MKAILVREFGGPGVVELEEVRAPLPAAGLFMEVFRWEFGWKVPLREKLRLRRPRLPKSASHVAKAARCKSPGA